ncbi:hypothetical protein ACMFWY_23310 [Roseiconus sp. JC912]|uniref:hypothetical protein n=2 Tax=Pirellulaceae TaxID=2691357 RepID=UPI003A4C68DA
MAKRTGVSIKREGNRTIVLASTDDRKFVQLTSSSVAGWSKARIAEMSDRKSSIAENSFVSAVVHALSNDFAVSLWGSDAQHVLASGHWSKLFDTRDTVPTDETIGDPFEGDPFK